MVIIEVEKNIFNLIRRRTTMSYDREAARKQLMDRQKQSASKAGSGFISVLKSDLPIWKCLEGKHKIDILPFVVGKKHPELKKGEIDYKMDVWLHSNVGVDNAQYLCLKKMTGEDCPICDRRAELQENGEDKEITNKLKPKHNALYNIICYDSDEQKNKGVQLWMINTWNMEDRLTALAEEDSGEPILFPDAKHGKCISFKREGTTMTNTRYTAHKFKDRDYKISDKLLDSTLSLDELLVYPTYEEVSKADSGANKRRAKDSDDGDSKDRKSSSVPDEEEVEEMTRKELKHLIQDLGLDVDPDSDELEDKDDLCAAVKKALKKYSSKKDKDDDDEKDVPKSKGIAEEEIDDMTRKELKHLIDDLGLDIDPDAEEFEDKDDLRAAVKKALNYKSSGDDKKDKKKKDDDDDEKEEKSSKSDSKEKKCPLKKGKFGEDFDKYSECVDECNNFDACSDAFDEMKEKEKSKSGSKLNKRR